MTKTIYFSTRTDHEKIRLTKAVLNEIVMWSKSRYNDWLGFGTKKQNVDTVYNSLVAGFYTDERGKQDKEKTVFEIQCATSVGENGSGRYWQAKTIWMAFMKFPEWVKDKEVSE